MKRFYLLIALFVVGFISFGYSVTARAAGFEPVVAEFEGNQAVKLEVGTGSGDSSWMSLIFDTPIDPSDYPYLNVSFDIYRSSGSDSNDGWLPWGFSGANFKPWYGGQSGDVTFPFVGSGGATASVSTVTDQYGWVELEWDFTAGTCSSWYNDTLIDNGFSLIDPPADPDPLTGFTINLTGNNAGGEVVWVDNFFLWAENDDDWIWYEYFYEDNLLLGALDGQGLPGMGRWEAGADNPVPIPGAAWLLGSGIIVLIGIRRKRA